MSVSDEMPGTSSSSYSNSSSSSSVENISSTVENGELSVFTFMVPTTTGSCGGLASSHSVPTDLTTLFNQPSASSSNGTVGGPGSESWRNGGVSPFCIDPYRLDDPYTFHTKYHRQSPSYGHHGSTKSPQQCCPHHPSHTNTHHHVLSDNNYIRLLPRTGDGLLLRSLEKGGKVSLVSLFLVKYHALPAHVEAKKRCLHPTILPPPYSLDLDKLLSASEACWSLRRCR